MITVILFFSLFHFYSFSLLSISSFPLSLFILFSLSFSLFLPLFPFISPSFSLPLLPQFPDLASFLIARACRSTTLANYFHWFVYVQCQEDKDPVSKEKYESIRSKFLDDLRNVSGNVAVIDWHDIKVLCTSTFYCISNGTCTPTTTNNMYLFVTLIVQYCSYYHTHWGIWGRKGVFFVFPIKNPLRLFLRV